MDACRLSDDGRGMCRPGSHASTVTVMATAYINRLENVVRLISLLQVISIWMIKSRGYTDLLCSVEFLRACRSRQDEVRVSSSHLFDAQRR